MADKNQNKHQDNKKLKGHEPNFTTPDPTKESMDAWIKKHITPKVKSGKKQKESH